MSGVLRLSNNVTGRSTIIASASNDQTYVLPALGGTLVTGGASSEIIFPPGTEALPGLHVQGDIDTGLYAPAANTLGISTAGSERLRIDSSGNVGIGTSSPGETLVLKTTSGPTSLRFSVIDANDFLIKNEGTNTLKLSSPTTDFVTIDSSGKVGIGTTSPGSYSSSAQNLVVANTSGSAGITIAGSNGSTGTLMFADGTSGSEAYRGQIDYQHASDAMVFFTNGGAERMRIGSSGNVTINSQYLPATLNIYPKDNPTSPGRWEDCGLGIGNSSTTGHYSQIGLGYFSAGTWAPSYIGFVSTNQGAFGYGDLVFGTRSVNTDSQANERLRISAVGKMDQQAAFTAHSYTSVQYENDGYTRRNAVRGHGKIIDRGTGERNIDLIQSFDDTLVSSNINVLIKVTFMLNGAVSPDAATVTFEAGFYGFSSPASYTYWTGPVTIDRAIGTTLQAGSISWVGGGAKTQSLRYVTASVTNYVSYYVKEIVCTGNDSCPVSLL